MGHDLIDQVTEDGHQHENGEHLVLQALKGVVGFEKRETNEQCL